MTKAELIERIARSRDVPPDLTKKDIALVLGIAFEELAGYFARAKVTRATSPRFTFPKFGTFTKKRRSARRGVNPRTLEPMEIEAFDTVDFKASRELREALNPGSTTTAGNKKKAAAKTKAKSTRNTKAKSTRSAKASKKRRSAKRVAPAGVPAIGGRRLTPRDEAAEFDAMIADDELFASKSSKSSKSSDSASEDALPVGRLQRVESVREPTASRNRSRRNLP